MEPRSPPRSARRESDVSFLITPGPSLEPVPAQTRGSDAPRFLSTNQPKRNDSNHFTVPAVWRFDSTSAVWEVSCVTPARIK